MPGKVNWGLTSQTNRQNGCPDGSASPRTSVVSMAMCSRRGKCFWGRETSMEAILTHNMHTTTGEIPGRRRWLGEGWTWAALVVGSLALAAATLPVLPHGIGYDPLSWLIWGREIGHLTLDTRHAATAVKPLPIAVDVLLAPAGSAAPLLWLVVARAGTLLSLALAFRLARRLGGVLAGVAAVIGLALADEYLGALTMVGMSEPLTVAMLLAAADSHLRDHHRAALAFLVLTGLLRPEVWPAMIGYGLWLAWAGGWWRRLLGALLSVAVLASWFVVDWFGAHQLSRSTEAATHQSQGGPLLSRVPGLATFAETWSLMSGPVLVGFLLGFAAALVAWSRRGRPDALAMLSIAAVGWVAVDAVLAQLRWATGASRYLLPAAGLACVIAGCLVADLFRWVRARTGVWSWPACALLGVLLVAACVPRMDAVAGRVAAAVDGGSRQQALQERLPAAIAAAGGRRAILQCGPVSVGPFDSPRIAWQLRLPVGSLGPAREAVTGTVIESHTVRIAARHQFHLLLRGDHGPDSRTWTVLSTCPDHVAAVSRAGRAR